MRKNKLIVRGFERQKKQDHLTRSENHFTHCSFGRSINPIRAGLNRRREGHRIERETEEFRAEHDRSIRIPFISLPPLDRNNRTDRGGLHARACVWS